MKKFTLSALLALVFTLYTPAQNNTQIKALPPYFQQEVNYTIRVELNDVQHTLSGFETIQYINNSPDELSFLYFHLWPNAYRNNNTAFAKQQMENGSTDFHFSSDEEKGFIDSLHFVIEDKPVEMVYDQNNPDICKITLPRTLKPGDTILLSTPFYVKIPGSFSRFGHVGQSYQITQWFPKPAVYDRNGWNAMPYLDQGEFYSEYGFFDVSITLPADYVVAATGNLITTSEIAWLNQKATETADTMDSVSDSLKTIHYRENHVHDFAWFADKSYRVLKGEVVLASGHKVTTWAMFPPSKDEVWKNSLEYIGDAITYYSRWYAEYPYDNCTAVSGSIQAGGAMEYPTITVVGATGTRHMLEDFIMHEVGHNWFYGILGFNERKYPILDEGINTFSEFRYTRTKYPDLKFHEWLTNQSSLASLLNLSDLPMSEYYNLSYLLSARAGTDQAMDLPSESFTATNYGTIGYYKSSLVYTYLLQYLGEERFNKIMQDFFAEWSFKHPGPSDLRKAFEENTHEDLSWLFDGLMSTKGRVDYAILKMTDNKVLVKNKGQVASPVKVSWMNGKSGVNAAWYPGFTGEKWLTMDADKPSHAMLFDSAFIPEYNRRNNYFHSRGLFKRMEPLKINMIQLVEKPHRTLVGFMPLAGWNNYNKTMLGVLLYNPLLPEQTFEYQLMPMFGFGNHDFAGMGKIALNIHPLGGVFQTIKWSVDARRFGSTNNSYNRLKTELLFTMAKHNPRSPLTTTFKLAALAIDQPGDLSNFIPDLDFKENYFITFDADLVSKHALHPFGLNLNLENSDGYLRSSLTFDFAKTLRYAPKAIQLRIFAGKIFEWEDYSATSFQLSGQGGVDDYRYDNLYLGRYERPGDPSRQKLLSQQFVRNEGGFVSDLPFDFSQEWLATAGLMVKLPVVKIFSVFANAGTYDGAGSDIFLTDQDGELLQIIQMQKLNWEAGIMVKLGILRVYFPVAVSQSIADMNKLMKDNYVQTIRYSIDFNAINPFKIKSTLF